MVYGDPVYRDRPTGASPEIRRAQEALVEAHNHLEPRMDAEATLFAGAAGNRIEDTGGRVTDSDLAAAMVLLRHALVDLEAEQAQRG